MPRNHVRINQTSKSLLQCWRGNCDIQIIIYESDPDDIDLGEISKVTDYVVAYSCKAGVTYREELDQNKQIVMGMQETTGDLTELKSLCRHITNKSSSSRLISKPEASVLLGGLDLVACSDYIESVSISNSKKLTSSGHQNGKKNFLIAYQNRPAAFEDYSLHDYYMIHRQNVMAKKPAIPYYVGVKGYPTYPVTEGYARHVLIVYKPWRQYPNKPSWLHEFNAFVNSSRCPKSATLTYNRVMRRYYDGTQFLEPTASASKCDSNMTDDDAMVLLLAGLGLADGEKYHGLEMEHIPRGIDYLWGKIPAVSVWRDRGLHVETRLLVLTSSLLLRMALLLSLRYCFFYSRVTRKTTEWKIRNGCEEQNVLPELWLLNVIDERRKNADKELSLPLRPDGKPYRLDGLFREQMVMVYHVLNTLRIFLTIPDLSKFMATCFILMGQGGTGKSVVLNTITSVIRHKFNHNDTVATTGPTGSSAFNVFGETLHRFLKIGIKGEYKPNSMSASSNTALTERFKHLLCLIIDERSLLTSNLLGSTSQILSETIFHGSKRHELFGGIPILLLAGDDYQLPGMHEGALQALQNKGGSPMTRKGRSAFLRCAEKVLQLKQIRRVCDDEPAKNREMLERVRIGENIQDSDVDKIMSLHLDVIRDKHGPEVVAEIEKKAVYLFWTNEKRMRLNHQRLLELTSDDNPAAIIRPWGHGPGTKQSIRSHFNNDPPDSSLIFIGAKVCIQGCNFWPQWGLFNGACGTVEEIVFDIGKNPNMGHHPKYVVVDFPQYVGPAWDKEKPKVCC
jgi:PIF1-like helicase